MIVRGENLDRLNSERFVRVLREHADKYIVDDLGFRFVGGRDVDENVAGFGADLRVVGIYYRGHGADGSVGIEDDGIDRRISYYMKVSR